MAPKDDPESSSEQPKYGVDQEYCPLDSAPSFESTQVVGAGVGIGEAVGPGVLGAELGGNVPRQIWKPLSATELSDENEMLVDGVTTTPSRPEPLPE